MNKTAILTGLIGIPVSCNAMSDEVRLACTGESFYRSINVKHPYSFTAAIDLGSKNFSINIEESSNVKKPTFPRDNLFPEEICPNPKWNVKITETEIQININCGESQPLATALWEIRRTNGTFIYYWSGEELARGTCVKSSERAF